MLQTMWVYDDIQESMVQREITYVPGLYKIFDEILGMCKLLIILCLNDFFCLEHCNNSSTSILWHRAIVEFSEMTNHNFSY